MAFPGFLTHTWFLGGDEDYKKDIKFFFVLVYWIEVLYNSYKPSRGSPDLQINTTDIAVGGCEMAVVRELIRTEENGNISFGDYGLDTKSKLSDFDHKGDMYKVKTFKEITKLERNGVFVYESVPGTAVFDLEQTDGNMGFRVEGQGDAQITVGLEENMEYEIFIDQESTGKMRTNLGGKLSFSVELANESSTEVKIMKL